MTAVGLWPTAKGAGSTVDRLGPTEKEMDLTGEGLGLTAEGLEPNGEAVGLPGSAAIRQVSRIGESPAAPARSGCRILLKPRGVRRPLAVSWPRSRRILRQVRFREAAAAFQNDGAASPTHGVSHVRGETLRPPENISETGSGHA
ncbi:hypothetical protein Q0Z83_064030 [Actinoplanes sichuanensis]|nr:hypothetical protein Q0Z83_064030 [Actinoplanes sichuanensis]